jgi:hypothetical protein
VRSREALPIREATAQAKPEPKDVANEPETKDIVVAADEVAEREAMEQEKRAASDPRAKIREVGDARFSVKRNRPDEGQDRPEEDQAHQTPARQDHIQRGRQPITAGEIERQHPGESGDARPNAAQAVTTEAIREAFPGATVEEPIGYEGKRWRVTLSR